MAAVLPPNISYTNTSSTHMPKMSTSRRGVDGALSKRVIMFCNGDKFFRGKKVFIVPSRYHNFSDFLNDLTGKLPSLSSLPYGVRQIFSPTSGRKIRQLDELTDGKCYVCAGFEHFRPLNYGDLLNETHRAPSKPVVVPRGSANLRHRAQHVKGSQDDDSKISHVIKDQNTRDVKSPRDPKSKLFVVISNAIRPRKIIRIFLSQHALSSMERLISELQRQFALAISNENGGIAAGESSSKIRRLYSIHGVEITSPADFFKADDHYIALGSEKFTTADLKEIIAEIYPNGTWPKNIFKSWENQRTKKRKPAASETTGNNATQKSHDTVAAVNSSGNNKQSIKDDESVAKESTAKTTKTSGKVGGETTANTVTQAPPPPVAAVAMPATDSRSRIDGERMKKDSGFVDEITKESNSPNHHVNTGGGQSVVLTSVEQQSTDRSPRGQQPIEPVAELPTVFEAKSVENSSQAPPKSVSVSSDKHTADTHQEKTLKPVQPPTARKPPSVQPTPDPIIPSQPPPASTIASHAQKTTRDVDPELAHLLDQQQAPSTTGGNVQKYSILPEIGKVTKKEVEQQEAKEASDETKEVKKVDENQVDVAEKADDNTEKQGESLPAEQPVLQQAPAAVDNAAPEPVQPPVVSGQTSSPAAAPNQSTQSQSTSVQPAAVEEKRSDQQKEAKAPQPSTNRPKLEHAPLIIDGKPDSRPGSRSSTAAPGSAPGRVVVGKLSRQLSRIDHVLARFEYLGKQLGDGNFAVVRRCRRRKTGAEYAMKVIDKAKLKGKFHMVENEIRIMRACDHRNLVKLYEMYETDKEIFLVMELVPDGDLFDAITGAVKFDEPTASKMVQDMASGLFYMHSRKIVHRDLKPENLLVLRSGNAITLKLGDFGLAMEVTEPIYSVCGTPTYVAPEILTERGYGLEVDLWALGVITYILMCGFPPFRSQKRRQSELFDQIKSGKFVFLSPYWDSISVLAKELISKLLIVDARRRYTSPDVLCHPWVISHGGATPQGDMVTYRKTMRKNLEEQSKANWKQWVSVRQKKGFNAILPGNGQSNGARPSSRN